MPRPRPAVRFVLFPLLVLVLAAPLFAQGARAWDRDAVYAQREGLLKAAVVEHPDSADALAALAAFYLKPLAPREVAAADGRVRRVMVPLRNEWSGPIKDIVAVPWVFRGDTSSAWPLLTRALKLAPNNPAVRRELAMYYRMRGDLDRMKPHMEAALKVYPYDLDLCRLYLDHRTALARVLNDQAGALRTPRTWTEDRADGRYRVTQNPSQADLAQAKSLDAQAQEVRRQAIKPLMRLAKALKEDPRTKSDPALFARWQLTTAIYFAWLGELEKSAGTAVAALRKDPTYLDALDFVVDTLRLTHTRDKLPAYKSILDRWGGVDSTPVIVRGKRGGPKG
ncbi:MAG: hypothetical protein H6906_02845 [Hyphomicrobiales bacterium]|nr:hypothetical protein [Hyphomicrobiales bacterium]